MRPRKKPEWPKAPALCIFVELEQGVQVTMLVKTQGELERLIDYVNNVAPAVNELVARAIVLDPALVPDDDDDDGDEDEEYEYDFDEGDDES